MFKLSKIIAATLAVASLSGAAYAQEYPNRSIRLVVPFPAAGATDNVARVVAQKLGIELGQPVVVDNRAGAAGVIGSDHVAKSAADGYTLLLTTPSTHSIGPLLNPKIQYNPKTDFTPIIYLAQSPQVMIVPLSSPAKTVAEFIAYAKANPGKLNFGSAGTGGIVHLSGERFKSAAGLDMTHIPYKGTALAMPDLIAGRLDLMFDSLSTAAPMVRDGKVRALGVTSDTPVQALPNVPPVSATVPGYGSQTWFGVFGPANLPEPVVAKLNAALNKVLLDQEVKAQMQTLGFDPAGGTQADFAKKLQDDVNNWQKVITEANIKLD